MKQLFGTDGIRGHAGEFPLDEPTVSLIGASLARQMTDSLGRSPIFISGRDTRESGEWIERAFHAGAASEGAKCVSAGVITTPGVAFLTGEFDFDAGVVISASHNPYQDNGIKIFSPSGKKLDEATERRIEKDIDKGSTAVFTCGELDLSRSGEFHAAYIEHLIGHSKPFERPFRMVVDCANGASSGFAAEVFGLMGADVVVINDAPDGRNINLDCGSLHLEALQEQVVGEKADFGVAFDGDADRALFVDETGKIVDGDGTLWIIASSLKQHGKLANSKVISTVMSNIGLELALGTIGVELVRTSVGDKYVLEELLNSNSEIGGEQSGHIIFVENSLVGDGMMTALLLLRAIREKGQSFSELAAGFTAYPQVLVNIKVGEKRPFENVDEIMSAAAEVERELDGHGRLLLRYSGTENLARVMIEGRDQTEIETLANRLAGVIGDVLGKK